MRWAAVPVCCALAAGPAAADGIGLRAQFGERTDRYGHNVLGGNEYAGISVAFAPEDGVERRFEVSLPDDRVIEDVALRLADLTGDGVPEIVTVEASRAAGAELVVYGGLEAGALVKRAATPPIGRPFRWLAPAGIADFDGDGRLDVAYVETPHLGGTLRIWTLSRGELIELASATGFSNHRIGEPFITGGVRDCGSAPELVLPNFGWTRLMAARLVGAEITAERITDGLDLQDLPRHLACGETQ
ncbi:MAG: VCBS repeat-containing protein [Pseudomonadota bacterium]